MTQNRDTMVSLCIRKVDCDLGNMREQFDLGSTADVCCKIKSCGSTRQPRVCCLFRGGGELRSLQYKLYISADSMEISQQGPGLRIQAIKNYCLLTSYNQSSQVPFRSDSETGTGYLQGMFTGKQIYHVKPETWYFVTNIIRYKDLIVRLQTVPLLL